MASIDESTSAKIGRGVVAGLIAGAVASFAMARFQAGVSALSNDNDDQQSEPATEKAADAIARQVTGHDIPQPDKPLAGQAIHDALGIGLGIASEFKPSVKAGYGAAFGIGTATLLDQGVVPVVDLGEAPWKASVSGNLYAYASHLVFGAAAELVRQQVAGTLKR